MGPRRSGAKCRIEAPTRTSDRHVFAVRRGVRGGTQSARGRRMHRKITLAVIAAGILVAAMLYQVGVFSGARLSAASEVPEAGEESPPSETAEVEAREVVRYFAAVGSVTARERSRVASRIRGTVLRVAVRAGDRVKKGDLLVRLEADTTRAKVGQARQNLEAARAERVRAEKDFERFQRLHADEAATERRLEAARAAVMKARAAEARAQEALNEAETIRSRTVLRAPGDGQVARRLVDPGDLAVPGKPLVVVQTPGSLRLSAFVREGLALRVELGDELHVRVPAADLDAQAPVAEIVPSVDPKSRAFELKVALPDADALMPGMFGRVAIPAGRDRALMVPVRAIRRVGQLELVRAKAPGGAWARRHVTTGKPRGDEIEVLSGLESGELVAMDGGSPTDDG